MGLFDFNTSKKLNLKIETMKTLYNELPIGSIFYEVRISKYGKMKPNDIEILREFIVIEKKNGKVTTICIHHCENYAITKRTDWKKKIAKAFRKYLTPKQLEEKCLKAIPLVHLFDDNISIGNREHFNSISTKLLFFKEKTNEESKN